MTESVEERYDERLSRLSEILADIAGHAQDVSRARCPYKSKPGLCTAKFSCRNQQPTVDAGSSLACTHDGTFDYRLAWESRPESYDKVRAKLQRIRAEAEQARAVRAAERAGGKTGAEPDGQE
jgi:hypothetical protein